MITPIVQDYLKSIYKQQQNQNRVTTNDLAKSLKVSPASVTSMLKKLKKLRLIRYKSYQGVELLPAGEKVALEVLRHHRLIELYLKEALGYSWDSVHEEAEKLEHHISEDFEEKIFEMMGKPEFDPHGDPIPTKDGKIPELICDPLSEANPGEQLIIRRVNDQNPQMLRYLEEKGLIPKTKIEVIDKAPFNGPFTVKVDNTNHPHVIGREVVESIYVSRIGDGS